MVINMIFYLCLEPSKTQKSSDDFELGIMDQEMTVSDVENFQYLKKKCMLINFLFKILIFLVN